MCNAYTKNFNLIDCPRKTHQKPDALHGNKKIENIQPFYMHGAASVEKMK